MLALEPAPGAPELSAHRVQVLERALQGACTEHGGKVAQEGPPGLLAVFPATREALDCALEIQKVSAGTRLGRALRIAVHTAQDPRRGFALGDYSGPDLDKTRRVLSLGVGGQVLVTSAARRSCPRARELAWRAWPNRNLDGEGLLETLWELLVEGDSAGEPGSAGRELLGKSREAVARRDWEEALQGHLVALEKLREASDLELLGQALDSLGAVLLRLDRPQQAEQAFREALLHSREVGDLRTQARVLQNLGVLQSRLGRFQEAEACWDSSRLLWEESGERLGLARSLRWKAMVRLQSEDLPGARESLGASLEASEEAQDARNLALGWWARGLLDQKSGDLQAAEEHLRRALEFSVAAENRPEEARVLSNLGLLSHLQGRHDRAARLHRSALALLQEEGDRPALLRARLNAAVSTMARGQAGEARRILEECFDQARELGDKEVVGVALADLALLMDQSGDWAAAITVARRAAQVLAQAGRADLQAQVQGWLQEWAPSGRGDQRDLIDRPPV